MTAEKTPTMWIPTCCGRVMRYNTYRQPDGGSYGALVCTICSKNITLEQEPLAAVNDYGEGSSVLSVLGAPKPPMVDRRKSRQPVSQPNADEPTV